MPTLSGIRVLDLTFMYAGPSSTMYLADQGADVIKVEQRTSGDPSRRNGTSAYLQQNSLSYMSINRGKRSMTLDLAHPEGQEIVRKLAGRADVLVESFRPGVAERLGCGYEALSELNPRLIYASLSAYGTRGPYAGKAGYDPLVQGMTGAFSRRDAEGRPTRTGVWLADLSAPMLMAYGIMLALFAREHTGRGQRVETSLLQAAISMQLQSLGVAEDDPTPKSVDNPPGVGGHVCSDGNCIQVSSLLPHQWKRLCEVLDLPHLADDPRVHDSIARVELRQDAAQVIDAIFGTRPAAEWLELLNAADVPCAPIIDRPQVPYEEQVVANEMMVPVQHPVAGRTRIVGVAVRLSDTRHEPLRPAPTLGQHTEEVLSELGYPAQRIEELRQLEVI